MLNIAVIGAEDQQKRKIMADIKTVRLILGDQLNSLHSWFREPVPEVLYVIAELRQETDYVNHHIQKVVAFFMSMSQFADGGIVGTKPYVSSANYINKMGHYCKDCYYDHDKKTGERACPFNSLYWHFYERNRDKLSSNPRIGMMYRVLDRMSKEDRKNLFQQAEKYLNSISDL